MSSSDYYSWLNPNVHQLGKIGLQWKRIAWQLCSICSTESELHLNLLTSAIGVEPSKGTPSLQLLIGLRSIGPEQQSSTAMPSNLPDSLAGESNLQKAGESAPADQAESSPSIESHNASSQQVLSLVPNCTSGHTCKCCNFVIVVPGPFQPEVNSKPQPLAEGGPLPPGLIFLDHSGLM